MIVILEGCDGSGKTTFADAVTRVAERSGIHVENWSRGVPKNHVLVEYELAIEQSYNRELTATSLLVCDRWHLGELIYGPIYRDGSQLDLAQTWHVNRFLESRGAVVVIISLPVSVVHDRLNTRGDDYISIDDVGRICTAYRTIARDVRLDAVMLTSPPDDSAANGVIIQAQVTGYRTHGLRNFPSYVGPPDPEILLLGDQRAPNGKYNYHRAAFVPYHGTSGHWLCRTIVETHLAFKKIGIANAYEENVVDLVRALCGPRVVTLGSNADTLCTYHWDDHGSVPHPQYGRRFHHHDRLAYADAIVRAADKHEKVIPW